MCNANRGPSYNYFSKQHLMEISRYEEARQAHKMTVAAADFIPDHVNHTQVSLNVVTENGAEWHVASM